MKREKRHSTLAYLAEEELRERILNGELAPGQPLLLAETAESLGMSIMPVREALRRLEFEGLVEQLPQKGARVSPLDVEELEDIYNERISMESRAVFRAVANFTERDYEKLRQVLQKYREAYEAGDKERGRKAHEQFHFGLYALAKSRWTMKLIRMLWDHSERYRRLSVILRGSIAERIQEHIEILEACREGDAQKAADLMAKHLTRSYTIVKDDIIAHLGRGVNDTKK